MGFEACFEGLDSEAELAVFCYTALYLLDAVDDGGVVAVAEALAYLYLTQFGVFLGKEHGELAHHYDVGLARLVQYLTLLYLEVFAKVLDDIVQRDVVAAEVDDASHDALGQFKVYLTVVLHTPGHDAVYHALEFADIVGDGLGDIVHNIGGEAQACGAYLGGENVAAQHHIGTVHFHNDAPFEPVEHSLLDAFEEDGRTVASHNNLASVELQVVEDVEEGALCLLGVQFLYVIDDEDIYGLVEVEELVRGVVLHGVHILRLEELCCHEEYALVGEFFLDAVAYGGDEVCLSHAGGTIEEEGVESGLAGLFRYGLGYIEGGFVADAFHEVLEGVVGAEV